MTSSRSGQASSASSATAADTSRLAGGSNPDLELDRVYPVVRKAVGKRPVGRGRVVSLDPAHFSPAPRVQEDWVRRVASAVLYQATLDLKGKDEKVAQEALLFLEGEGEMAPVLEFWCMAAEFDPRLVREFIRRGTRDRGGESCKWQMLKR